MLVRETRPISQDAGIVTLVDTVTVWTSLIP
jgi:hypothetical protein